MDEGGETQKPKIEGPGKHNMPSSERDIKQQSRPEESEAPSHRNAELHKEPGWFEEVSGEKAPAPPIEVKVSMEDKGPNLKDVEKSPVSEQRSQVRKLLDKIETYNEPLTSAINGPAYQALVEKLPLLEQSVADETMARLRLHATVVELTNITGKPEDYPNKLREVVSKLGSETGINLFLQGKDLNTLFSKEGLGGDIPVVKVFKFAQKVAYEGTMLGGREVTFIDKLDERERGLMKELLKKEANGSEKAVELSDRLLVVLFERSVLNRKAVGNDPLAQAIYLEKYRKSEGADKGPKETISMIPGFGTSFLRQLKNSKGEYFFNNDLAERAKKIHRYVGSLPRLSVERRQETAKAEERMLRVNRIEAGAWSGTNQTVGEFVLGVDQVDFTEAADNALAAYYQSYLPGILKVKELLLKSSWEPADFSPDEVASWFGPFDKADPDGVFNLKYYFILGALHSSIIEGGRQRAGLSLWSQDAYTKVAGVISPPEYSLLGQKQSAPQGRFLTNQELDEIRSVYKIRRALFAVTPTKF